MPTLVPRSEHASGANLEVADQEDWDRPLVLSPAKNVRRDVPGISVDDAPYISFGVTNSGVAPVTRPFFVDIYFDEYLVHRFPIGGELPPNFSVDLSDWPGLAQVVKIVPGDHALRIVVDSTHLIPEANETDNVFEQTFRWEPSRVQRSLTPTPAAVRLPNLAPFTAAGWDAPVVASSFIGDTTSGPLSADVVTFLKYGITNNGLTSVPGGVLVDLYLDDVLVLREFWTPLLAGQTIIRPAWTRIHEIVELEPGIHVLKLKVDPTDLVRESSEEDNVYELVLEWGIGSVPARTAALGPSTPPPTAPAVLTLPNLVPGWVWERDGPIVVSHFKNISLDGDLTVEEPAFVDVVVFNESIVDASDSFVVDLYFDDEKVHTFQMSGPTPARVFRFREDWPGLASRSISPGSHTVKIVIDPANAVEEADEADNVLEKTYVWGEGPISQPVPVTYTDSELRQMLSDLMDLLDKQGPAMGTDGEDLADDVMRVAEAGYYLLTGTSLQDERVNIALLAEEEYLAWIDDSYDEQFAVSPESEYAFILAGRERDKSVSAGFKSRRFGEVTLVVNAEKNVTDVINSVVHELGHMRQDFLNPIQSEMGDFYELVSVREAEAQQFERAFWLAVQRFTGIRLLDYPDYEGFLELIDFTVNSAVLNAPRSEHSTGRLLQWLVVLVDPAMSQIKERLLSQGELDEESALAVFEHLVRLDPESLDSYVSGLLASLGTHLGTIKSLAQGRLISDLHPDGEGSPDLRIPALLAP